MNVRIKRSISLHFLFLVLFDFLTAGGISSVTNFIPTSAIPSVHLFPRCFLNLRTNPVLGFSGEGERPRLEDGPRTQAGAGVSEAERADTELSEVTEGFSVGEEMARSVVLAVDVGLKGEGEGGGVMVMFARDLDNSSSSLVSSSSVGLLASSLGAYCVELPREWKL